MREGLIRGVAFALVRTAAALLCIPILGLATVLGFEWFGPVGSLVAFLAATTVMLWLCVPYLLGR